MDAINTKRNYISRVLAAMSDGEPRILLYATLTMGESEDLDAGCKQLKKLLGVIPQKSDAWSKVEGMFWFLHEERGESRRTWRPHYHCVLLAKAADFIGFDQHYRRLVLAWTRAAWAALHPHCPIPESEASGTPFRTLWESQQVRPLFCFQESALRSLQGSQHDRSALVDDLSAMIEYGLQRKGESSTHPRGPRMRPRDYVKVALRVNNKRGLKGSFHGIASEALRDGCLELDELTSPMEAEQNGRNRRESRNQ